MKYYLRYFAVESRMRLLSIAAASIDVQLAGDAHRSSGDGCIEKRFAKKVDRRPSLSGRVGGPGESAEARGAFEGLLRTRGQNSARAVLIPSRIVAAEHRRF